MLTDKREKYYESKGIGCAFCGETHCFAGKDGTAYYFDDDHMSLGGARLFAQALAGLVLRDMQLARH